MLSWRMEMITIRNSTLSGRIAIPPSKSHTMRALLFATLAKGTSRITRPLTSPDVEKMIHACRQLGAGIDFKHGDIIIEGVAGKPQTPKNVIDAGNSGQVLRFVAALAALTEGKTRFTGDMSVRMRRPVLPLIEGLTHLGAKCEPLPLTVQGPIRAGTTTLDGADSQPVSALIIAATCLQGKTEIHIRNPGETPWIALTLSWLDRFGVSYQNQKFEEIAVEGPTQIIAFNYVPPGDFSSAAFPLAAALITHSEITLENLDMRDTQGDKQLISLLQEMGANLILDEEKQTVHVKKSDCLQGKKIDVNSLIDAVPILAVLGCYAKGTTHITGARIARNKECDRLFAITKELKKMGADIQDFEDGLIVKHSALHGAEVNSHDDHRIAMALAVAGLGASGNTVIHNTSCISKSYPSFCEQMKELGARV